MPEAFSKPSEANEGRQVGADQQRPEEGFGLWDEEARGLVGHGQGAWREGSHTTRRARTYLNLKSTTWDQYYKTDFVVSQVP